MDTNGWTQWEKHVLIEIDRLYLSNEIIKDKLNKLESAVSKQRLRLAMWSATGGGAFLGCSKLLEMLTK